MNRRQKIIVSVTGIFIVLLILIGLTYAYFLTRITGNSNPTSISVTTANLELVYGDGTTALLTSATPIEPGKFSSSKDFTVTNNGNALTEYAVTLEDFAVIYANDTVIDGVSVKAGTVTKMEYPGDMEMEITCTIESEDEDRNGTSCSNTSRGMLPIENSILVTNDIEVGDTHKYVLTLTYVDSGIDQSKDMNKTIKGKIDIIDPKSTIDIRGTVATYEVGDYVEINSTPIKSEIIDGKYKLVGVEPGSHILYVKYKDENGDVQTRGSQTLTIKKGEEASVLENTRTFTDASREATIGIGENYQLTINEVITNFTNFRDVYEHISGYYIGNTGTFQINKESHYIRIPVNEGEYWTVWYPDEKKLYSGRLRYENSANQLVSHLDMYNQSYARYQIVKDTESTGAVMQIPAGVSYMCVNLGVGTAWDYTENAIVTKIESPKWFALGDSITARTAAADGITKPYLEYISEEFDMSYKNLAAGGTGYAYGVGNIVSKVSKIPNDVELITIFGSFNDSNNLTNLGTAKDVYVEGGNNSIAAHINYVYDYIEENLPNAKLAVILPTPWAHNNPDADTDSTRKSIAYVELLKEICDSRNIPYLDLYNNSGMTPWDENYKNEYYFNADGTHPNDAGHAIIAPMIVSFLKDVLEN